MQAEYSQDWPLCLLPQKHQNYFDASSTGAQVRLRGSVSSQFLTALLMASPLAMPIDGNSTDVVIADELVSQPYVAMTIRLMERFGVQVCGHLCECMVTHSCTYPLASMHACMHASVHVLAIMFQGTNAETPASAGMHQREAVASNRT